MGNQSKGFETIGSAAARLLRRIEQRAKQASGGLKRPEQIHEPGVSPCREEVTGAAPLGPPRAPVTVTHRVGEDERWGLENQRYPAAANDNRADFTLYERGEAKQ